MIEAGVTDLLRTIRACAEKIAKGESLGQLERGEEIEARSFVQVLQSVPSQNPKEPIAWAYSQFWIDTLPLTEQGLFVGAYLNEVIGPHKNTKVIGIFNPVNPK